MTANYELPPWLAEALRRETQMMRNIAPIIDAIENARRVGALYSQAANQAAKNIGQIGALYSQPAIRAAETARQVQTLYGPPLAFAGDIAAAMDAGMAQLSAAVQLQAKWRSWPYSNVGPGLAAVSVTAPAPVAVVVDSAPKAARSPADQERQLNAQAMATVFICLVLLSMPAAQVLLPPEAQAMLSNYYSAIALALAIQWRMRDKHKD